MTTASGSVQYSLFDEEPTFTRLLTGKAIQVAREERGLSVRALAKLARVDPMTILRIESGDQSASTATAQRLSIALERSEAEIVLARAHIEDGTKEHLRDVEPWERDEGAREAVRLHPDGLTGEQVAELLELSPSSVDSAQESALAKLYALASQEGTVGDDVRDWIANVLEVGAARRARESAHDWMGADVEDSKVDTCEGCGRVHTATHKHANVKV